MVKFLSISQQTAVEFLKRNNIQIIMKVYSHNSKKKNLRMKIQTALQNCTTILAEYFNTKVRVWSKLISHCALAQVENF